MANASPIPSVSQAWDLILLATIRPDRLAVVCWWLLTGKRLRARYRLRDAIASLPFSYERRRAAEGRADLNRLQHFHSSMRFCVHIHLAQGVEGNRHAAAKSALRQSHRLTDGVIVTLESNEIPTPNHRLAYVLESECEDFISGLRLALEEAQKRGADYCIPLRADVTLPRHAVAAYAGQGCKADARAPLPILFADQDEGRPIFAKFRRGTNPWLKPQWDERMAISQDYVSSACALPVDQTLALLAEDAENLPPSLFGLILRTRHAARPIPIEHVPRICARTPIGDWSSHGSSTIIAVESEIRETGSVVPGPFGTAIVQWRELESLPKISVIVATRDKLELLQACMDGLLHKTDYPALEIVVADNQSQETETLAYLDAIRSDPRVKVVRWPHPFNYSAINNFAVTQASGEYLCLLNNDIEVLHPEWLRAMVREGVQPGVGAVGARLLYPDRSIQHAGVVIGMGNAAGHAHRALPEGEPGYFAQAYITRGASAVTAACLLVKKSNFDLVGGLDEKCLAVAYNDVDFCLKLRLHGLSNIYAPDATLIHHESKSRGLDFSAENFDRYMNELAIFQKRWSTCLYIDPWHHQGLNRSSESYCVQNITDR